MLVQTVDVHIIIIMEVIWRLSAYQHSSRYPLLWNVYRSGTTWGE